MDVFALSRNFFDWSFENPEAVSPNHIALYFFIVEHNNRLGWKEKFGLPTQMSMDAIGIKNYKTWAKTYKDLVDWGFIRVYEKSTNQYSSNIIALVKITKAHTKALAKASLKHTEKHGTKQVQSIVDIDIPNNLLTLLPNNTNTGDFDSFWNLYEKKVGEKSKLEKKWNALTDQEKKKAMDHIPKYKLSQPDKKYRKDPETYLNNKSWNDEIIFSEKKYINGNHSGNNEKGSAGKQLLGENGFGRL